MMKECINLRFVFFKCNKQIYWFLVVVYFQDVVQEVCVGLWVKNFFFFKLVECVSRQDFGLFVIVIIGCIIICKNMIKVGLEMIK